MIRTKKKHSSGVQRPILQIIHQQLIRNGQKQLAYRILQNSLNQIQIQIQNKNKTQTQTQQEQDPLLIIEQALRNVTPSVTIQTRRIRGAVYPIPTEIPLEKGVALAIRWIIRAAKKRSGNSFSVHLASEFLEASKKIGHAYQKKEEMVKLAAGGQQRSWRNKKKNKKKK